MFVASYQPIILEQSKMELIKCSPAEAQPFCNFILFETNYLPTGFVLTTNQLRKESAETSSSFRTLLTNNKQSISIKQFLYDWAPAAYDYPCLWLNTKKFSHQDFPPPRPIAIENNFLWVGKNYRGQNAATIAIERTRIEITFDNVELTDEELIKLVNNLQPCDEALRTEILNTPFAKLAYYFRHNQKTSDVPLSFWKHLRLNTCYTAFKSEEADSWLPAKIEEELNKRQYVLNSIVSIISEDVIAEKEYLFEHSQYAGLFVHVLATPHTAINHIKFPPAIGDQVCSHETIKAHGKEVYLAYTTHSVGNYEFVFNTEDFTYLILIKGAPWISYQWALKLILAL